MKKKTENGVRSGRKLKSRRCWYSQKLQELLIWAVDAPVHINFFQPCFPFLFSFSYFFKRFNDKLPCENSITYIVILTWKKKWVDKNRFSSTDISAFLHYWPLNSVATSPKIWGEWGITSWTLKKKISFLSEHHTYKLNVDAQGYPLCLPIYIGYVNMSMQREKNSLKRLRQGRGSMNFFAT